MRRLAFALLFFAGSVSSQTLRIGLAEDPDILDPSMARTFVGRIVFAGLCDKLFDLDEKLNIVPQLATSHKWSADNKSLELKLRSGVTFHDGEKFDAAAVKYNLERHKNMKGSNRRGELARGVERRGGRPLDGAHQPRGAVRAAARGAHRPLGHDGVAQGGGSRGREVRRQAGVLRAVPLRRAHRAGPHRARALHQLLEQGPDPLRAHPLPADRRRHGAPCQPALGPARLHRARGAVGRAAAAQRQPLQARQDRGDRLPGHHHQRRQERHRAEEPARQGPARARGVRALARPRGHRQGRDGRRGAARQPVGRAVQPVLRQERAAYPSATSSARSSS